MVEGGLDSWRRCRPHLLRYFRARSRGTRSICSAAIRALPASSTKRATNRNGRPRNSAGAMRRASGSPMAFRAPGAAASRIPWLMGSRVQGSRFRGSRCGTGGGDQESWIQGSCPGATIIAPVTHDCQPRSLKRAVVAGALVVLTVGITAQAPQQPPRQASPGATPYSPDRFTWDPRRPEQGGMDPVRVGGGIASLASEMNLEP